jgi:DNA-binding SARP family transcriptional activator
MIQSFENQIITLRSKYEQAPVRVQTLGNFQVWREGEVVTKKDWGRDKTIQLFQFFVTARHRKAMHKEQIMDRLWEEDGESGDQNFKVALHGVNKVLEPNKKSHAEARFVLRQGLTYQLNTEEIWIDSDALESYIAIGNQAFVSDPMLAQTAYREALALQKGSYLPDRIYEDWSCDERERLQVLILGALITLAGMLVQDNPMESIRLSQQALLIDTAWEDAYRIQMEAYLQKGNRPMAIKTYQQCEKILHDEMGIQPLPETRKIYQQILSK